MTPDLMIETIQWILSQLIEELKVYHDKDIALGYLDASNILITDKDEIHVLGPNERFFV